MLLVHQVVHVRVITVVGGVVFVLLVLGVLAVAELADDTVYDARLTGFFNGPTAVQSAQLPLSTALVWIVMLVLLAVSAGVMFKDAKRSHLD